jgi:hypothetical protein
MREALIIRAVETWVVMAYGGADETILRDLCGRLVVMLLELEDADAGALGSVLRKTSEAQRQTHVLGWWDFEIYVTLEATLRFLFVFGTSVIFPFVSVFWYQELLLSSTQCALPT